MDLILQGLGTALPRHSISQHELAAHAGRIAGQRTPAQTRILGTLFRMTGIKRRGSVLLEGNDAGTGQQRMPFYVEAEQACDRGPTTHERMQRYSQEAGALALVAARQACTESGILFPEFTHLITVSCTGFFAPGIDVLLIKQLSLSPEISRLHVGFMGCHGAINGLRAANAFAMSDPHAKVLLCAVELCSLHFQYNWNRDHLVANSLFSDGAAALVVASKNVDNSMNGNPWRIRSTASYLFPDSEDAMSWKISDHGFEMTLSQRVPDLIAAGLKTWVTRWLESQDLKLPDIKSWAIHPGGPRILNAVAESLNLCGADMAASRHILEQNGNMSSPTVIFILDHLRKTGASTPCVLLGFGPGLVAEAVLLF